MCLWRQRSEYFWPHSVANLSISLTYRTSEVSKCVYNSLLRVSHSSFGVKPLSKYISRRHLRCWQFAPSGKEYSDIFASLYNQQPGQRGPPALVSLEEPMLLSWSRELLTFCGSVLLIAHYPMTFSMWHVRLGKAVKSFSWQEGHSLSDLFCQTWYSNNDEQIPSCISVMFIAADRLM